MKVLDSTGLSYLVQKLKDMFSLTTHNHDTAYAAKTHTHAATDVTSGTLSSDRLPTVPLSKGGTGATDASTARSNLGAAATSHNHSASQITSGTLSVARGGTGVTTNAAIGLKAYPVGAVYISYVSTSPASLFGGSWTAITGRFPYFNAKIGTGGSNTHTHGLGSGYAHIEPMGGASEYRYKSVTTWSAMWKWGNQSSGGSSSVTMHDTATTLGGSTDSGNNMPSYQMLYAWRRTA